MVDGEGTTGSHRGISSLRADVRAGALRALEVVGLDQAILSAVAKVRSLDQHSLFLSAADVSSLTEGGFPSPVSADMLEPGIGYLALCGYRGFNNAADASYVDKLHRLLTPLASGANCGWVVDLWDHDGGNMWPGLAAVAPILGEGTVGFFIQPDGQPTPWVVEQDLVMAGSDIMLAFDPPAFINPPPTVAVIIGPRTASSGEALALAFRNRPDTRFFGHPHGAWPAPTPPSSLKTVPCYFSPPR